METKDFRTQTVLKGYPAGGEDKKNRWIIGLDVGYSSVKGMTRNSVFCFPSYVEEVVEDTITVRSAVPTDIYYRDKTGLWAVGEQAYYEATSKDMNDSNKEMTNLYWYNTPRYKIATAVGLALGMRETSVGKPDLEGKPIVVQTGLPPKVRKSHTSAIKNSMAREYDFDLKVGKDGWEHYHFTITEDNVYVADQPLGALISASINMYGKPIRESPKYFNSNVIVFDPGSVTVDTCTLSRGKITDYETFTNLGMYEIFSRTCKDIEKEYGEIIDVARLQTLLETGKLKVINREEGSSKVIDITEILERNCRNVCEETIEKMKHVHDYFSKTDYIIATGGTYDAWKDMFDQAFAKMEGLKIIPANKNELQLSNVFSNVRGYYYYRLNDD